MRTWEEEQFLEELGPALHNGVRDRGLRLSHHCGDGNKALEVVGID